MKSKLHYQDEGKGKTLLFVHGFPFNSAAWSEQIAALKGRYRVLAPDLRGFGKSPAAKGTASITDFADDLKELIDDLGTGPVILIGHSMGGYIALNFAQRYPSLLKGLVLVATKSTPDTPEAAQKRRDTAQKVLSEGADFLVKDMAPKMLAKNAPAERVSEVKKMMLPAQPEGVAAALLAMAEREDTTESLSQIKVPTLIITGQEDSLIPKEESKKMAAKIPHFTLTLLADAGHLVPYEKPREFNEALKEWIP